MWFETLTHIQFSGVGLLDFLASFDSPKQHSVSRKVPTWQEAFPVSQSKHIPGYQTVTCLSKQLTMFSKMLFASFEHLRRLKRGVVYVSNKAASRLWNTCCARVAVCTAGDMHGFNLNRQERVNSETVRIGILSY